MSAVLALDPVYASWDSFRATTRVEHIGSDERYDAMTELADALVEDGAMGESHAHHSLFLLVTDLIYAYDQRRYPLPHVSGPALVRFLMDQHGLRQSDLPEIGSQGVVSEVLSGRRELSVSHIRGLAKRFNVSPAAFL
jgi:HTH-type transcriptional regulator/antitoxin HigA